MAQSKILQTVKKAFSESVDSDWEYRALQNEHLLAENLNQNKTVIITPMQCRWVRHAKGRVHKEHIIAVVLITKGGIQTVNLDVIENVFDFWAENCLTKPDFLPDYPVQEAATIDNEELGFEIDERAVFVTGLKITLWEFFH